MGNEYTDGVVTGMAVRNGDDGFGFGNGSWIWVFVILALFGGWGGGFGGFGGSRGGSGVIDGYILNSDMSQLDNKIDRLANGISSLGYDQLAQMNGINSNIAQTGFGLQTAINGIGTQLQNCCCEQKMATLENRYLDAQNTCAIQTAIATSTRDIVDNANANYRALHEEIVNNRIEDYKAQIAARDQAIFNLQLAASQEKQNNYLVDKLGYKTPDPCYVVPNPYVGYGYGNGCGCNQYVNR